MLRTKHYICCLVQPHSTVDTNNSIAANKNIKRIQGEIKYFCKNYYTTNHLYIASSRKTSHHIHTFFIFDETGVKWRYLKLIFLVPNTVFNFPIIYSNGWFEFKYNFNTVHIRHAKQKLNRLREVTTLFFMFLQCKGR